MPVEELDAAAAAREAPALARILHACVEHGASVGFVQPFTAAEAERWWRGAVIPSLAAGGRRLFLVRAAAEAVGTAQLLLDTPPNGRHRAEVAKVLVHPRFRRRGVARALMAAAEAAAREAGRTLLTLDTVEHGAARPLYRSLGFREAGVIPRFARSPDGAALEGTVVMFRELA